MAACDQLEARILNLSDHSCQLVVSSITFCFLQFSDNPHRSSLSYLLHVMWSLFNISQIQMAVYSLSIMAVFACFTELLVHKYELKSCILAR